MGRWIDEQGRETDDGPLFGAFLPCGRCEGEGEIITGSTPYSWNEPQEAIFEKCPECLGFRTVWVEEGC